MISSTIRTIEDRDYRHSIQVGYGANCDRVLTTFETYNKDGEYQKFNNLLINQSMEEPAPKYRLPYLKLMTTVAYSMRERVYGKFKKLPSKHQTEPRDLSEYPTSAELSKEVFKADSKQQDPQSKTLPAVMKNEATQCMIDVVDTTKT